MRKMQSHIFTKKHEKKHAIKNRIAIENQSQICMQIYVKIIHFVLPLSNDKYV